MAVRALATTNRCTAFGSRRQRSAIVCNAQVEFNRRAALAASLVPTFFFVPKANALILDEEDEEMLEKAKANRAKRLAEQRETTRQFMQEEGLDNRRLDQKLVPVQRAVNELAKSGSQIEAADLKAAATTLSGSWVAEFQNASLSVSLSEEAQSSANAIFTQLDSLKSAAGTGDVKASKKQFVAVVNAVDAWATQSGVRANLKGL